MEATVICVERLLPRGEATGGEIGGRNRFLPGSWHFTRALERVQPCSLQYKPVYTCTRKRESFGTAINIVMLRLVCTIVTGRYIMSQRFSLPSSKYIICRSLNRPRPIVKNTLNLDGVIFIRL